jgi:phosphoglycolate phosphatase
MSFKGVIFDLDGTLADTLVDIAGSMNRILEKHGYPVHGVSDYKQLVGRGLDNLVRQALPDLARQPQLVTLCLAEMIDDYNNYCLVQTHLYEGISDMMHKLQQKGLILSVFSNKAELLTQKIVHQLLPDVSFFIIAGARSDFPKKPDPAGALLISEQTGIAAEHYIYVGDSDVDMQTANRAGMYAVGVSWGFRTRDELFANGAKILLDHPFELLALIDS